MKSSAPGEKGLGVCRSHPGQFVDGHLTALGQGTQNKGEIGGAVEKGVILPKDQRLPADGEEIRGIRLNQKTLQRDGGGEARKRPRAGGEERAADAKPDIGTAEDGMRQKIGGEGDAMEKDGRKARGPRLQRPKKGAPGPRSMEDDRAPQAGGQGELGVKRGTLGSAAVKGTADAVKANLTDDGRGIGAKGAGQELKPIRAGRGDVPRVEAKPGGDAQGTPHFHIPLLRARGAIDARGNARVKGILDEAGMIWKDACVSKMEVGIEHVRDRAAPLRPEDLGRRAEANIVRRRERGITREHLIKAVAAELLGEGGGKLDEQDAFEDDAGPGDGTSVGALIGGLGRRMGGKVDALLGGQRGGDGLHRGADDKRLPRGDAALETASAVGGPKDAAALIEDNGVVAGTAREGRVGKGIGEGHALDGIDGKNRRAKAGVETTPGGNVGTEANGQSVDDTDDEAAESLTLGTGDVDGIGVGILLRLGGRPTGGTPGEGKRLAQRRDGLGDGAKRGDVRGGGDAQPAQEGPRDGADCDATGRLAGAGTLKGGADVVETVFDARGKVGMAGAGDGVGGDGLAFPGGVVAVWDGEGDGRAGGAPRHDAGKDGGAIGLDIHAATGAGLELAPGEVGGKKVFVKGKPGGDALDDDGEGGPVGFACGEVTEGHCADSLAVRKHARPGGCQEERDKHPDGAEPFRVVDCDEVGVKVAEHLTSPPGP